MHAHSWGDFGMTVVFYYVLEIYWQVFCHHTTTRNLLHEQRPSGANSDHKCRCRCQFRRALTRIVKVCFFSQNQHKLQLSSALCALCTIVLASISSKPKNI